VPLDLDLLVAGFEDGSQFFSIYSADKLTNEQPIFLSSPLALPPKAMKAIPPAPANTRKKNRGRQGSSSYEQPIWQGRQAAAEHQ
jgi:hypothetical protein